MLILCQCAIAKCNNADPIKHMPQKADILFAISLIIRFLALAGSLGKMPHS
jgi:hypothetical protein